MPSFFCMPFFACNRQVDSLDKRQCNLQSIPHEIERYSRTLEELLLDMNHIRDLPKSLFRLHKLRRLGLSDNDIHRLPSEITALQNLVELNISRNDISDLPDDLKNCRNLSFLDVSSNPIARLPESITLVTSLTQLSLNDTSLTKLPQDIGQLHALRSLEVRENHLRTLPSSIVQLVNLVRLDLGQNELDVLPAEIGALRALQELYADDNSIESLPESILQCTALEQLDVSSNRLLALPVEIGELSSLVDLTLSHNCLSHLPNSIGRLKRLSILRMDDNSFLQLTPAIGSCTALTELYLTQNLISELPSTIGNLHNLQNLNADKNQLICLPPLIGECTSLTLLSLRDNQIEELPMEIGKLSRLRVLDVCNNRLSYLPFTINVLFNLQALWLSENQSQALMKFSQDVDPRTGMKVLTCYLLPQQTSATATNEMNNRLPNRSFVGGPKVHFGGLDAGSPADGEEAEADHGPCTSTTGSGGIGNFERHGTPHPKPGTKGASVAKPAKKNSIDGHIIPHIEEHDATAISKKVLGGVKTSNGESTPTSGQLNGVSGPILPRPALKHSTAAFQKNSQQNRFLPSERTENAPKGSFANKLASTPSASAMSLSTSCNEPVKTIQGQKRRVIVRREPSHGLGLSIAGGLESNPYVKGDCGLFISKLIPGAPAEKAGLRVGDKILEINGTPMLNQRHDVAVECIQNSPDVLNLLVLQKPIPTSEVQQHDQSKTSQLNLSPNVISMACRLNEQGLPPFSIRTQSDGMHYVVSPLESSAAIQENDRLLSVNGISVDGKSLAAVMELLRGVPGTEIYLLFQREKNTPLPQRSEAKELPIAAQRTSNISHSVSRLPSSSMTSLRNISAPISSSHPALPVENGRNTKSKPELVPTDIPIEDKRLDGTIEEVELKRDSNNTLGLSIVGGVDHCSHPFGVDAPGIFISKIAQGSPAAKSGRLRVGDRILSANNSSVECARHSEAVDILKKSGPILRLKVCHDPQPCGLREISFRRRDDNSRLGLTICGGINTPVLSFDPTDEGVFIDSIDPGGGVALDAPELRAGMRILEVNDESLLGCTRSEAAALLRAAASPIRLLVCDGTSNKASTSINSDYSISSCTAAEPSYKAPLPREVENDHIVTRFSTNVSAAKASLPAAQQIKTKNNQQPSESLTDSKNVLKNESMTTFSHSSNAQTANGKKPELNPVLRYTPNNLKTSGISQSSCTTFGNHIQHNHWQTTSDKDARISAAPQQHEQYVNINGQKQKENGKHNFTENNNDIKFVDEPSEGLEDH